MKHLPYILLGVLLSSVRCFPVEPAHADAQRDVYYELTKQTQILERIARSLETR